MGINGDDAIELFQNDAVVDTFGAIDVDGSGETWEYTDGWAYRKDGETANSGTFDAANWTFSGTDALDGEGTNTAATTAFQLAPLALKVVVKWWLSLKYLQWNSVNVALMQR